MNVNGNTNSHCVHPEDPQILTGEYNFEDDFFNLEEPNFLETNISVIDPLVKNYEKI